MIFFQNWLVRKWSSAVRVLTSLHGEVIKVEGGIVQLRDPEDKICFVAIDKIVVVWDAPDEEHRAGFVS